LLLPEPAATSSSTERFIPVGEIQTEIIELASPPRCQELTAKMRAAIQQDPEWWLAHAKTAQGGPIPYHPKMGLTQAEYAEVLEFGNTMTAHRVAYATFHVTTADRQVFTFAAGPPLEELDGIEVDLAQDEVRTPFGTLSDREKITAEATRDSPTGAWNGMRWKFERVEDENVVDPTKMTGAVVHFSLGQLVSGEGILYYSARVLEAGEQTARVFRVLFYELEPAN